MKPHKIAISAGSAATSRIEGPKDQAPRSCLISLNSCYWPAPLGRQPFQSTEMTHLRRSAPGPNGDGMAWLRTKQMPDFRTRFESLFADFSDDPGLALRVTHGNHANHVGVIPFFRSGLVETIPWRMARTQHELV